MHRTSIYISDEQHLWLKEEAKRLDIKHSEIIRRALDHWIELKSNPVERLLEEATGRTSELQLGPKPFGIELRERLERIEWLIANSLSLEERERLDEAAEEVQRELFGETIREMFSEDD